MAQHNLKTVQPYFESLWLGEKNFECRKDDRGFKEGDLLVLEEYKPETKEYTNRKVCATISYILRHFEGLTREYCIIALTNIENYE